MPKRQSHIAEYIALGSGLIVGGLALNIPAGLVFAVTAAGVFVLWLANRWWG